MRNYETPIFNQMKEQFLICMSIGNYKKAQWLSRIMLAYERCEE